MIFACSINPERILGDLIMPAICRNTKLSISPAGMLPILQLLKPSLTARKEV